MNITNYINYRYIIIFHNEKIILYILCKNVKNSEKSHGYLWYKDSVNFFRIFAANLRFLTSSTWFSAFIFSQAQIICYNSEKIFIKVFS